MIRDREKSYQEFVSKAQRERERLEFLGLGKKSVPKPINYINAYPDHRPVLDSAAIIETVTDAVNHSENVPLLAIRQLRE